MLNIFSDLWSAQATYGRDLYSASVISCLRNIKIALFYISTSKGPCDMLNQFICKTIEFEVIVVDVHTYALGIW